MMVPIIQVRALVDPYQDMVWEGVQPLSMRGVQAALHQGRLQAGPLALRGKPPCPEVGHRWHHERVAWFVVHSWTAPILLDTTHLRVTDGLHRLAAALYRGDEAVLLHPFSCRRAIWG